MVMVCKTEALLVKVPMLKVTNPLLFVLKLPKVEEIGPNRTLVVNCTKLLTPLKVVRPLLFTRIVYVTLDPMMTGSTEGIMETERSAGELNFATNASYPPPPLVERSDPAVTGKFVDEVIPAT